MNPLVSITVPVYNKEKYLPRCIESLIDQSLHDIEILLVNDGSTDKSGEICDKYAEKDSRIRVFHKENGGSASARQVGLYNSKGIYYTVCDPDDWVELNMYEEMYKEAVLENADIVLSSYYINFSNGKQTQCPNYDFQNQDTYIYDVMYHKTSVSTCTKIFKLETIRKNNVDYIEGINLGEDIMFLCKLLLFPLKIVSVKGCFYHYQRLLGSNTYTNHITMKTFEQAKYVCMWKNRTFSSLKYERVRLYNLILLGFIAIRTNDMTSEYFDAEIAPLISIKRILKERIFTFKALSIIVTKIMGYKCAKLLFKCFYSFFHGTSKF